MRKEHPEQPEINIGALRSRPQMPVISIKGTPSIGPSAWSPRRLEAGASCISLGWRWASCSLTHPHSPGFPTQPRVPDTAPGPPDTAPGPPDTAPGPPDTAPVPDTAPGS